MNAMLQLGTEDVAITAAPRRGGLVAAAGVGLGIAAGALAQSLSGGYGLLAIGLTSRRRQR
jgi:hypothetical protein